MSLLLYVFQTVIGSYYISGDVLYSPDYGHAKVEILATPRGLEYKAFNRKADLTFIINSSNIRVFVNSKVRESYKFKSEYTVEINRGYKPLNFKECF